MPQMLEWISCNGFRALAASPKGFLIVFPAKQCSHIGKLICDRGSYKPSLAKWFSQSWLMLLNRECQIEHQLKHYYLKQQINNHYYLEFKNNQHQLKHV